MDRRRHMRVLARRRALARRRSGGAAIFIVAVTLGLLAVMGVYGLSATAADVKSAGHMREALQAQKAGEHALMMTAETFNPRAAPGLVADMALDGKRTPNNLATPLAPTNCRTALPHPVPSPASVPPGAQCVRLQWDGPSHPTPRNDFAARAAPINPYVAPVFVPYDVVASPEVPGSFGKVDLQPFVKVEASNPIDWQIPGNSAFKYTQITVTVFVELRRRWDEPPESVAMARGRVMAGPFAGSPATY
ncbi:MAG: hypothetical protein KF819_37100 [Labilithrix sp.]|nr:hypothetical protein [Labilithrix sp.]